MNREKLTSAAIKANVFKPPKNPTPTHTINMNPDKIRIVDNNATNRKCDHPGVVGENESCNNKEENNELLKESQSSLDSIRLYQIN